jgi:hypothetical protein
MFQNTRAYAVDAAIEIESGTDKEKRSSNGQSLPISENCLKVDGQSCASVAGK